MTQPYYYNKQLRRYIVQFMSIFTVFMAKTSDGSELPLTVQYGTPDRVAAAILANNTQNSAIQLPAASVFLTGLTYDADRASGLRTERRTTFTPVGGLVGEDTTVVHQIKPLPYSITLDLTIWTSNVDQQLQLLEQILPLFKPQLMIQTSDGLFDWTRLSAVILESINIETNNMIGTDPRLPKVTLSFKLPIYIDSPADVRADYIKSILVRIGMVNMSDSTSDQMLNELDIQNVPYDTVVDSSQFTI